MLAFCILLASLSLPLQMEPGAAITPLSMEAAPSHEPSGLPTEGVLAGTSRPGKAFTKKQKQTVKQNNAEAHGGTTTVRIVMSRQCRARNTRRV